MAQKFLWGFMPSAVNVFEGTISKGGLQQMTTLFNSGEKIPPSQLSSAAGGRETYASNQDSSRRRFMRITMGGAVAGLATVGLEFATPRSALAQSNLSPDAALKELMDGNGRFRARRLTSDAEDLAILRQNTAEKQEPFAAVLSCADSRVPVELVFDQSIGHVFVTRVAGNVATSEIIASLEYGAAVLGTKVILVLGHGSCGAVKATIAGKGVPGQISALYPHIQPAVDQAGSNLEAATKANAKIQAALLRQASTVISGLVKESKLKVVAGYYDITGGSVTLLD
jgi:carbonic anhydrase